MADTNHRPGMIRRAWQIFRSAVTGRFVSRQFAEDRPKETVSERRES